MLRPLVRTPRARWLPVAATLGSLLVQACTTDAPQGEPELAQRLASAVSQAYPDRTVRIADPGEVVVTDPDGTEQRMFLNNLRAGCLDAPEDCDALIARQVGSLGDIAAMDAPTAAQLRPILKDASYLAEVDRITGQADTPELVAASRVLRRPFHGALSVLWVLDMPDSMGMVSQSTLDDLGLSQEAMEARALDNLVACCSELPVQPVEGVPGVFQMWVGDSYEAARLLLHQAWAPLVETVPGGLVAVAPSREVVLFTGSEDSMGKQALATAAQGISESAYGLEPVLLLWTPLGWQALDPAGAGTP